MMSSDEGDVVAPPPPDDMEVVTATDVLTAATIHSYTTHPFWQLNIQDMSLETLNTFMNDAVVKDVIKHEKVLHRLYARLFFGSHERGLSGAPRAPGAPGCTRRTFAQ